MPTPMPSPPTRHVVLFEPDPSGHRMVFVRYLVEAMARRGTMRATLMTSARGQSAPWLQTLDADLRRVLTVSLLDEPGRPARSIQLPRKLERQIDHIAMLRSAVHRLSQREAIAHVFLPFVDDYGLFPFAMRTKPFGNIHWSGIAIRPRFHLRHVGAQVPPRPQDLIERWAYHRMLGSRSLGTLFSIDPYLASYLDDPRVITVCDPADITTPVADRRWLPVDDDAVVLLVYGYIDHRKAIDRLLRIASDPRMSHNLVLALVGTQDVGILPVLNGASARNLREQGRLVEIPRHVNDHEEASAFARADIIWGYYPGSYCSSGAMVRAGQMGRPLMATAEGLVGQLTQQYGTGLAAREDDDDAVLQALNRLAEDAALRGTLGEAGRRHFASSTGAAFGDQIVDRLDGTMAYLPGEDA